jgi:hypothetical protein
MTSLVLILLTNTNEVKLRIEKKYYFVSADKIGKFKRTGGKSFLENQFLFDVKFRLSFKSVKIFRNCKLIIYLFILLLYNRSCSKRYPNNQNLICKAKAITNKLTRLWSHLSLFEKSLSLYQSRLTTMFSKKKKKNSKIQILNKGL